MTGLGYEAKPLPLTGRDLDLPISNFSYGAFRKVRHNAYGRYTADRNARDDPHGVRQPEHDRTAASGLTAGNFVASCLAYCTQPAEEEAQA